VILLDTNLLTRLTGTDHPHGLVARRPAHRRDAELRGLARAHVQHHRLPEAGRDGARPRGGVIATIEQAEPAAVSLVRDRKARPAGARRREPPAGLARMASVKGFAVERSRIGS
jgi:hypothetical protein